MNYQAEFEEEGFMLHLDPVVIDHIIEEAKRRQTGARGLDAIISKYLEDVAFDLFGRGDEGEITLTVESGEVSHSVKRRA
jgi:ATP-dependent protease Clp ATPase subunit